jgi:hypothetical protein
MEKEGSDSMLDASFNSDRIDRGAQSPRPEGPASRLFETLLA